MVVVVVVFWAVTSGSSLDVGPIVGTSLAGGTELKGIPDGADKGGGVRGFDHARGEEEMDCW